MNEKVYGFIGPDSKAEKYSIAARRLVDIAVHAESLKQVDSHLQILPPDY